MGRPYRGSLRRFHGVAVLAAALLAAGASPAWGSPSTAEATKLYNVTVTARVKTTWIDGGCAPYCVPYNGTVEWTQQYEDVRVASTRYYPGYVRLGGRRIGTTTARWDHANGQWCAERLTESLRAELEINATYYLPGHDVARGKRLQPSLDLDAYQRGPAEGAFHSCGTQIRPVTVVGRIGTSLVSGSLSEAGVGLSDFSFGRPVKGRPGAPLDQLSRGAGFAITLSGTTKDLASTKQDLAATKQATYTEGTVRIVFTPVARKTQRTLSARVAQATVGVASSTCAKTFSGAWSRKRRGCFLVTASARWQVKKTWTQDEYGAPCNGAETTTMSWKSRPAAFWVGDTFPTGYTSTSGMPTSRFVQGPLEGNVTVEVSGGSFDYRCVPLLSKDCGTRPVTFSDPVPLYVVPPRKPVTLLLTVHTNSPPASPFRSCGLVDTLELAPFPQFGGWVLVEHEWKPGILGLLDDLVEKRLLSTPVGGTVAFRAIGHPVDDETYQAITGYLTGAVTFRRVQ
jgi:hypothetical protein